MDEWGRLLSGCRGNTSAAGSNPALPAREETREHESFLLCKDKACGPSRYNLL